MSTSADQGPGPESDPGPWEALEQLTEVVDGIAAVQRETAEALSAVLALQREQQAVLPGSAPGPERDATEAQGPEPGLVAQTHQSRPRADWSRERTSSPRARTSSHSRRSRS